MTRCSRIGNRTLAAAAQLPQLTSLKLVGCVRITDAGLAHLVQLAGVLLTLYLDKCTKVTDVGVSSVAQVGGSYLCAVHSNLSMTAAGFLHSRVFP